MSSSSTIERQLQELRDLEEIRHLKHRYAYGANIVDGKPGDLEAFGALFTDSATFDVGMGVATGPAEIVELMQRLTTQWQCAMHYMLNPVIELDGDRARAEVTGLFAFTRKGDPDPVWMSNFYDDTFARTDAGWRFQSVAVRMAFADPRFLEGYASEMG